MRVIGGAFVMLAAVAAAQAQVPGSAQPGRVEERFRPPPAAQSAPDIEIPNSESQTPDAATAKIHFQLTGVVIEGATVFGNSDFTPLYQALLGKDVTLAQIFELRDAITAKYRRAGFVLSQAIIPPQKIGGGVVHIRVIEGYIDHVEFQGDARDGRGLIREMATKITEARPLTERALERYVLLVSDIPGVAVRTVIKPSQSQPGAADLVFILDHQTVSGTVQIDNRGSLAIGPEEGQISVDLNSFFGLDEQTSLLLATTGQPKEIQYGQVTSTWLLDAEGTRAQISTDYSDTKPSGPVSLLDAIGHTLTVHGLLDYPLIRSRSENLHLAAAFTYLNTKTNLLGQPFSDDRLRYFLASATYDVSDTIAGDAYPAQNLVYAELSQGADILDASKTGSANLSRANGHSDFTKLYLEASRTQSLVDNVSVALAMSGQVAGSPLLTSVQFGLGGARFGRGYEPSELTGDDGLAGSVEARYNLLSTFEPIQRPQLYAFYELGQIWNLDPLPGTPPHASLASAGLGIRFDFMQRFSVDLELAKPLTRDIASRGTRPIRPLFNISTRF